MIPKISEKKITILLDILIGRVIKIHLLDEIILIFYFCVIIYLKGILNLKLKLY